MSIEPSIDYESLASHLLMLNAWSSDTPIPMRQKGHQKKIGDYIINGVLGHGGMGSVYRVIHPATEKIVALKLLNPSGPLKDFLEEEKLHQIFRNEIQKMSSLHHPNIAEVLDTGQDDGLPFYTMEYYCNDLGMLIGEKFVVEETSRLVPPEKAINYGCQILDGLQYMHDAGILHRDIKPFNMMLNIRGDIKICDFGMARLEEENFSDLEGINIGSPYYTAPEQIKDADQADNRADLYSTGVLIYRMLTGILPSMADFMLSRVNDLYDSSWDLFFAKALSWDPDLRFQNAMEMKNALTNLQLHWQEESQKSSPDKKINSATEKKILLRTTPSRVSGTIAQEAFGVNKLWQPQTWITNKFTLIDAKMVIDEKTGLIWQQTHSDYPLDRISADAFIETLNDIKSQGIQNWRLPTVNELLSLVNESGNPFKKQKGDCIQYDSDWFWTCDRRSPDTSWYVNTKIGYTGWQNNDCLYYVRAVASQKRANA